MKKIILLMTAALMCIFISVSAYADTEMSYSDGTLNVSGLEQNAALVHVSYTDGRIENVNVSNAENGTQKVNAKNGDKFFIWNSIEKAQPLSKPIVVGEESNVHNKKTLVVYYSAQNHTRQVANYIQEAADADIFEIVPVNPYTSADLNWNNSSSRVVYEYQNPEARDIPLVTTAVPNWEDYSTVFIGYPIWWGIAAWPVNNFVKENDFTGKTVIPFCTSASSDLGESGKLLAEMAGTGDWQTGMRFRSSAGESDVADWVNGLK